MELNKKCYWLVKPDSYYIINRMIGSLYDDSYIEYFIEQN